TSLDSMRRLAWLALDHSRLVIIGFVVITVLLGLSARQIQADNATESLYPDDSRVDAITDELRSTFQQHDRLLLVVEGDIYMPEGLAAVRALNAALQAVDGVVEVTSVATAKRLEDDDGFLLVEDLV